MSAGSEILTWAGSAVVISVLGFLRWVAVGCGAARLESHTTVPGVEETVASKVVAILEGRLVASIDLQLVLKHIHWNVRGPNFIAVHEMLDEHVDSVREMTDDIAERIATIGGTPDGNAGNVVRRRTWDDYRLGRADSLTHLRALDAAYDGVITDHRAAIDAL